MTTIAGDENESALPLRHDFDQTKPGILRGCLSRLLPIFVIGS
jgi:hypothetical protein